MTNLNQFMSKIYLLYSGWMHFVSTYKIKGKVLRTHYCSDAGGICIGSGIIGWSDIIRKTCNSGPGQSHDSILAGIWCLKVFTSFKHLDSGRTLF